MSLSSTTFFHFTSESKALLGILENGFRITISHEVVYNNESENVFGIPMVCFCDIPLSVSHKHIKNFCEKTVYGFGMNRTWGLKNLHPVQYYPMQSTAYFQEHFGYLVKRYLEENADNKFAVDSRDLKIYNQINTSSYQIEVRNPNEMPYRIRTSELTGLIKPVNSKYYSFNTDSKEITVKFSNYDFYNEREWRYVLPEKQNVTIPFFCKSRHNEDVKNNPGIYIDDWKTLKERLEKEGNYLPFTVDDLSWIIVDREDTVNFLIKHILCSDFKKIGGNDILNADDKFRLIQKIVSYESIQNDVYVH